MACRLQALVQLGEIAPPKHIHNTQDGTKTHIHTHMQKITHTHTHTQELLADFKRRYDRERTRLAQALDKSQTLSRNISSIIPTIQSLERDLNKAPATGKAGMYSS
jgi:hypothetical protein